MACQIYKTTGKCVLPEQTVCVCVCALGYCMFDCVYSMVMSVIDSIGPCIQADNHHWSPPFKVCCIMGIQNVQLAPTCQLHELYNNHVIKFMKFRLKSTYIFCSCSSPAAIVCIVGGTNSTTIGCI